MIFKSQLRLWLKKLLGEEQKTARSKAMIFTPYKLTEEQMKIFYQIFPHLEKTVVENIIDKDLLGGFVIKYRTSIFDASINGKINNLVEEFL